MIEGIYLLLGSNLGDREQNLTAAIQNISESAGPIIRISSIYQTKAWGIEDQEDFLNQVVVIETNLKPAELLAVILDIEVKMGRIREQKWGTRLIDIDILFYNDEIVDTPQLSVPHPGIPDRRFTLVPLVELNPDGLHPIENRSLSSLLASCSDQLEVLKLLA